MLGGARNLSSPSGSAYPLILAPPLKISAHDPVAGSDPCKCISRLEASIGLARSPRISPRWNAQFG